LYEYETCSLSLREEHRLRVFGKRVLRRIFGPKREGGAGGCRRLHNEELHNLYASPNIVTLAHELDHGKYLFMTAISKCIFVTVLITTASRTALGPTQPPIQWVPVALSLGVKRPRREADHSLPSSAEVKECVEIYHHSPNTPSWRGA
jgi:hypothetical protein